MGRNRVIGDPLQVQLINQSLTTFFPTDVYAVNASLGTPVTVTLDPNAVDGDQYEIQDVAGNAQTQPIMIAAASGIRGSGASFSLATNWGQATFTFNADLGEWIVSGVGTNVAASQGVASLQVTTNASFAAANAQFSPMPVVNGGTTLTPTGGLRVVVGAPGFGAGESLTCTLRKNGTMEGVSFTLDATVAPGVHDFSAQVGALALAAGDVAGMDGVYVQGAPNNPTVLFLLNWR